MAVPGDYTIAPTASEVSAAYYGATASFLDKKLELLAAILEGESNHAIFNAIENLPINDLADKFEEHAAQLMDALRAAHSLADRTAND